MPGPPGPGIEIDLINAAARNSNGHLHWIVGVAHDAVAVFGLEGKTAHKVCD